LVEVAGSQGCIACPLDPSPNEFLHLRRLGFAPPQPKRCKNDFAFSISPPFHPSFPLLVFLTGQVIDGRPPPVHAPVCRPSSFLLLFQDFFSILEQYGTRASCVIGRFRMKGGFFSLSLRSFFSRFWSLSIFFFDQRGESYAFFD